jgi:DNA-binding beta-propeller fold protein YncE
MGIAAMVMKPLLVFTIFLASWHVLNAQDTSVRAGSYPTLGNAFDALVTADSKYVFVTVTNVGGPNYSAPDSEAGKRHGVVAGLQVFRCVEGKLVSMGLVPLGSKGANGATFLPGEKLIAIAVGDAGVAFVDVEDAIHGTAKPYFLSQGEGAGAFDVVATPDGKYLFSANEYGVLQGQLGNVGVIAVQTDSSGRVVHAQTIRKIPAGDKVPSLTISPDGSRLYVIREILPSVGVPHLFGTHNPVLTRHDCVQVIGTPPDPNGLITVVDVKRAVAPDSGEHMILSEMASGCSPVRAVEASNASALYVSARGNHQILAFSPSLLESDPDHALLRAFTSGGLAPVGVRLFSGDRMLLVANSNRFLESSGNLAVLDLSCSGQNTLRKTIASGNFPRDISLSSDGKTLYVANYTSRSLQVISVASLQEK